MLEIYSFLIHCAQTDAISNIALTQTLISGALATSRVTATITTENNRDLSRNKSKELLNRTRSYIQCRKVPASIVNFCTELQSDMLNYVIIME